MSCLVSEWIEASLWIKPYTTTQNQLNNLYKLVRNITSRSGLKLKAHTEKKVILRHSIEFFLIQILPDKGDPFSS